MIVEVLQLTAMDTPSVAVMVVGAHIEVGINNVVVVSGSGEVSVVVLVPTSRERLVEEPITSKYIREQLKGRQGTRRAYQTVFGLAQKRSQPWRRRRGRDI